jgi:AcrR family transcriptional regulator
MDSPSSQRHLTRPSPPLNGRRELNKIDKLRRITDAARLTFETRGYDDATIREIARRAKVALGTIFTYAADKRDLLFLVINPDYERIAQRAAAAVRPDATLLDNLLRAFRLLYEFFAESPQLSRLVLREMLFYDTGRHAARFVATRSRMLETCIDIVRHAQRCKDIKSDEKAELVGRVLFAIYQIEVRRWLASEPLDISHGLKSLEKALLVVIRGLSPTDAALRRERFSSS